jgi:hypothetical protein
MKIAKNGEKGMRKTGVDYHTCGDDIFHVLLVATKLRIN